MLSMIYVLHISPAIAQDSSPPKPHRDAQAIQLLQTAEQTAGWDKLAPIQNASATCTAKSITAPNVEHSEKIKLVAAPNHQMRIDTRAGSTIRSGNKASVGPSGQGHSVNSGYALSIVPAVFPFWTQWEDWKDEKTQLFYLGAADVLGEKTSVVAIVLRKNGDSFPADKRITTVKFYVSEASHLPIRMVLNSASASGSPVVLPVVYAWSEFVARDGIMMPNDTKIYRAEHLWEELTVDSVAWNATADPNRFTPANDK